MKAGIHVVFVTACLALTGCDSKETAEVPSSAAWNDRIADRARLIERLPDETWAYLRVPGLWGMLAAPKNNALARALSTEANLKSLAGLQQAAGELLDREFPDFAPLVSPFLDELRSPIELAWVGDGDQPLNADLVIEARIALDSVETVNDRMQQVAALHDMVRLITPAGPDTPGQLFAGPSAVHYRFDTDSQRLLLVTGMSVTRASLEQAAAWLPREDSALQSMERRIDESRQGMVLWADTGRMQPLLQGMLQQPQFDAVRAVGGLDVDQLALGFGTRAGVGTLAFIASGGEGMLWDLTLPQLPPPDLNTAGTPRMVFGLTLPGYAWLSEQMLPAIAATAPDAEQFVDNLSDELATLTGENLAQWMDALAGRLVYIEDDNGPYLLHQPAGDNKLSALLARMPALATTRRLLEIDGRAIHHARFSGPDWLGAMESEGDVALDPETRRLLKLYSSIDTHTYWLDENGMTLFAEVPQVLADRLRNPADQPLDQHLAGTGQSLDTAAVFASMRLPQAPRRNYYMYLSILQTLADLFDYPLDLASFPSARQLDLPQWGHGGGRLDFTGDSIGLALTFENHPGDLIYGAGGIGMFAVAGVVAAIAIPAYQDYVSRAEINMAMLTATSLKLKLESYKLEHGTWPQESYVKEASAGSLVELIAYQADPPAVVIELRDEGRIVLLPEMDAENAAAVWRCVAEDVRANLLPPECR